MGRPLGPCPGSKLSAPKIADLRRASAVPKGPLPRTPADPPAAGTPAVASGRSPRSRGALPRGERSKGGRAGVRGPPRPRPAAAPRAAGHPLGIAPGAGGRPWSVARLPFPGKESPPKIADLPSPRAPFRGPPRTPADPHAAGTPAMASGRSPRSRGALPRGERSRGGRAGVRGPPGPRQAAAPRAAGHPLGTVHHRLGSVPRPSLHRRGTVALATHLSDLQERPPT